MGVKSTIYISKTHALEYIDKAVTKASDEQLSDIMEILYGDELLYNYIVDEDEDTFSQIRSSHDWVYE